MSQSTRLNSNDLGFICDGVGNVDGYKRNTWYKPLQLTFLFKNCGL